MTVAMLLVERKLCSILSSYSDQGCLVLSRSYAYRKMFRITNIFYDDVMKLLKVIDELDTQPKTSDHPDSDLVRTLKVRIKIVFKRLEVIASCQIGVLKTTLDEIETTFEERILDSYIFAESLDLRS